MPGASPPGSDGHHCESHEEKRAPPKELGRGRGVRGGARTAEKGREEEEEKTRPAEETSGDGRRGEGSSEEGALPSEHRGGLRVGDPGLLPQRR